MLIQEVQVEFFLEDCTTGGTKRSASKNYVLCLVAYQVITQTIFIVPQHRISLETLGISCTGGSNSGVFISSTFIKHEDL